MPPQGPVNTGMVVRATGGGGGRGGSSSRGHSPSVTPPSSSSQSKDMVAPLSATYTPRRLLEHHSLPVAAYMHTPSPPPSGLDPKRPLLLYKSSLNTKVRAVSLKSNSSSAILATGPTLVIPESYTGWFSVVSGRCKGATCLTTIEDVADKNLTFFLTRHEVPSYVRMVDSSSSGNSRYRRSSVPAGHVLKLLGLFEDTKRKGKPQSKSERFAQCLDHRGQVIYVPLSATGKFYAIADKNPNNRTLDQVFLMSQLLDGFQLPLTVRLVCGYMARVPSSFTGLLKLESSQKEHVVLACTMTPEADATFLEMDLDSNFLLTPIRDQVFPRTPIYLKTKSYCEDQAEAWQRQIKITHHVTERRPLFSPTRLHNSSFSDTASSTGLLPVDCDSKARHTRGIRELKARDRSRESRRLDKDTRVDRSRDKSKSGKSRDKSRDGRSRDKSKESKLRLRIREKSKDRLTVRQGDATSFDILREKSKIQDCVDIKKEKSGDKDSRKISKQNTYIFQNGRNAKYQDKNVDPNLPPPVPEHSLSYKIKHSIDNQDYSTVLDDLRNSRIISDRLEEEDECQYAEICDTFYSTSVMSSSSEQDSRSSSFNHRRLGRTSRREGFLGSSTNQNWSFGTGTSSSSEDNHYSFTLLRHDLGNSFIKGGFSAGDILPKRQFIASSRHAYRPRSPSSSQC